ncbi:hypothetical protein ScPMuIL_004786 [Solemya velum]
MNRQGRARRFSSNSSLFSNRIRQFFKNPFGRDLQEKNKRELCHIELFDICGHREVEDEHLVNMGTCLNRKFSKRALMFAVGAKKDSDTTKGRLEPEEIRALNEPILNNKCLPPESTMVRDFVNLKGNANDPSFRASLKQQAREIYGMFVGRSVDCGKYGPIGCAQRMIEVPSDSANEKDVEEEYSILNILVGEAW